MKAALSLKQLSESRFALRDRVALIIQRGREQGWGATLTAEKILQELHR